MSNEEQRKAKILRARRLAQMEMELVRITLIEKALRNVGIEGLNFN